MMKNVKIFHETKQIKQRNSLEMHITCKGPAVVDKNVVQRAVGFEAEALKDYWNVQGKRKNDKSFSQIKDTKEALGSIDKLEVQSDNGNLELVTKPLQTEEEVTKTFNQMEDTLNQLAGSSPAIIDSLPKQSMGLQWTSKKDYVTYKFKAVSKADGRADSVKFIPQATIDIPFDSFESYIALFNNEEYAKVLGKQFTQTADFLKATNLGQFIPGIVLNDLAAKGFLKMVLMAIKDASLFPGGDDPKYGFPTMPRNRFSEMYEKVKIDNNVWDTFKKQVVDYYRRQRQDLLFPKGYLGEDNKDERGPTIVQWLNSIDRPIYMEDDYAQGQSKERKSDLLSPPPGQRTKLEGLGAYDMAGDVPFFELRDFMSHSDDEKPLIGEIYRAALITIKLEQSSYRSI